MTARRYQVVRHRTRIKNEVHAILHAHLVPKCPHSDLFNRRGRGWLTRQALPDDEREAIGRHLRELDRLAEDLAVLDREIAEGALDDGAVKRLMTITGVNLTVGDGRDGGGRRHQPVRQPREAGELLRAQPSRAPIGTRRRPSWAHQQGRAQPCARDAGRGGLGRGKAPGPLHAFFVRIRARRGHQIAAVAVARKLAVLCWHVLTKDQDYLWARPALVANKTRAMELQAGKPQKKGNRRGPAYAYNVKALRDQELTLAQQAERNYARFVDRWMTRPPRGEVRERLNPARNE